MYEMRRVDKVEEQEVNGRSRIILPQVYLTAFEHVPNSIINAKLVKLTS
jgi:hypothetical protein